MLKLRLIVVTLFFPIVFCVAQPQFSSDRYIEYPNAFPGKILKIRKALDANTGMLTLETLSGGPFGVKDMLAAEAAERQAHYERFGSFTEELAAKLDSLGADDEAIVAVQLKMSPATYLDKTKHSEDEMMANAKLAAALGPVESMDQFLSRYGFDPMEAHGAASAVFQATKSQLLLLQADPNVLEVSVFHHDKQASPELSTLAVAAYSPGGSVPAGAGSGVKAGTFEQGLRQDFLSCAGISPSLWDASTTVDSSAVRHTQSVFKTLYHSAPAASLYHRLSITFNGTDDVNYIVNNGVQTLSMSMERGGTSPYRSTYSEFLTMDDMAYHFPYPVFANPSANSDYTYEVNWQCYNAISVGNVQYNTSNTFVMANCTQTKNPPPVYGSCIAGSGANCAGDREMPHVVAPGIPNSGTTFATTCIDGSTGGSIQCGTSYSAPVVNGMAADVIAADSRLAGWPEKVRATLILTAQNVESGDWTVGSDERDGTGVVSGSEAVAFAQGHTSVAPNNTAVEKGMAANSFAAADFSASKTFYYKVPNPKPASKHLRVVLTWDSNPVVNSGINALSDLDLVVAGNSGSYYSASYDSNVEVVDIAASDLTAGSTYAITISPFANRIPTGGSANFFYYALAWEFVKDHAP